MLSWRQTRAVGEVLAENVDRAVTAGDDDVCVDEWRVKGLCGRR
jgi:hypothetical protein